MPCGGDVADEGWVLLQPKHFWLSLRGLSLDLSLRIGSHRLDGLVMKRH